MNTPTKTCPPLEDLAAFLDGRLSGGARAQVIAHVADCPRCYEVFTEAARFQLYESEEEEKDKDPPVIPFPRKQVFRWVSSIAAVLVATLAAIPLYQNFYTMSDLRATQLVNPVVAQVSSQDTFWDEYTNRGAPGASNTASATGISHDVLLGAHTLDLHLSLERNDREGALDDLAGVNTHIEEIGLLPEQAKSYAAIQRQIADGQPPRGFLQKAEQVEARLTVEDDPYFTFGKWLEAGRLAASAQSPDFFQAPENRKFLRAFLHHELENLDPGVATILEEIQETLAATDPSSLPYKNLQQQFESILKHYQEKSLNPP